VAGPPKVGAIELAAAATARLSMRLGGDRAVNFQEKREKGGLRDKIDVIDGGASGVSNGRLTPLRSVFKLIEGVSFKPWNNLGEFQTGDGETPWTTLVLLTDPAYQRKDHERGLSAVGLHVQSAHRQTSE